MDKIDGDRARAVGAAERFQIGDITVVPFRLSHDAGEPFGYSRWKDVLHHPKFFVSNNMDMPPSSEYSPHDWLPKPAGLLSQYVFW